MIRECLQSKATEKNEFFKLRNYQWFKQYFLHSNLWLCKNIQEVETEKKNDNDEITSQLQTEAQAEIETGTQTNAMAGVLYNSVFNVANSELIGQKTLIWDNISKEKDNKRLTMFGSDFKMMDGVSSVSSLRQDSILNGIVTTHNEDASILVQCDIGNESDSTFNVMFENNCKSYLTQCLSFAHANNKILQDAMKQVFSSAEYSSCKYQSAPVKLYDRYVVKATSDYGNEAYPSCVNILDYLRFSVTFNDVDSMLGTFLKTFCFSVLVGTLSCISQNQVQYHKKTASRNDHDIGGNNTNNSTSSNLDSTSVTLTSRITKYLRVLSFRQYIIISLLSKRMYRLLLILLFTILFIVLISLISSQWLNVESDNKRLVPCDSYTMDYLDTQEVNQQLMQLN